MSEVTVSLTLSFLHSLSFSHCCSLLQRRTLSLTLSHPLTHSLSLLVSPVALPSASVQYLIFLIKNVIPICLLIPVHRMWAGLLSCLYTIFILRNYSIGIPSRGFIYAQSPRPRPFPNVGHMTDPTWHRTAILVGLRTRLQLARRHRSCEITL